MRHNAEQRGTREREREEEEVAVAAGQCKLERDECERGKGVVRGQLREKRRRDKGLFESHEAHMGARTQP